MKFKFIKSSEEVNEYPGIGIIEDLSEELEIDIKDIKAVDEELAKASMEHSGYGIIDSESLSDISNKTGIPENDVQSIAFELGYNVE